MCSCSTWWHLCFTCAESMQKWVKLSEALWAVWGICVCVHSGIWLVFVAFGLYLFRVYAVSLCSEPMQ
jgi:hypothetical protein